MGDSTEDNCNALRRIHDEVCLPWVVNHGSEFDPKKYQLLHLSRKQDYNLNCPLPLNETQVIEAMEAVKYLGLWIDRKLQWNYHIKATRAKATISIGGLIRIAGSTWGCNYTSMRQLYQAVVVPQLSYFSSAWYQPESSPGHNKSQISSLQTVQSRAARLITGAFRATSIAALDVEAHILPVKHLLDKLSNEAVLRLASSPSYNDIIKPREA